MACSITYQVVASTPSSPLSYPSAPGCAAATIFSGTSVCVAVDDAFGTVLNENIQGATVTQAAVTHPTSTSVSCSPSPVVFIFFKSCAAPVTHPSSPPTPPSD